MKTKSAARIDPAACARELVHALERNLPSSLDSATVSEIRRRVCKHLWDLERGPRPDQPPPDSKAPRSSERGRPKRTVLFVGAGASAAFGFPVTNQILPRIWAGLHDEGPQGWRRWAGFKRTAGRPVQTAAAHDLKRFLAAILPGLGRSGAAAPSGATIVDIISMLDHSTAERQSPFPPSPETEPGRKLIQPAEELMRARQLLNVAINGVLDGRKDNALREDLAAWIIRRAGQGENARAGAGERRVTIISTNYDTSLERPLYTRVAGWRGGVPENIDLGLTWRDRHGRLHGRKPDANLAVFKLHGSLDWLRCETCGCITINTAKRIASLDAWDVKREYNSCACQGLLKSLLVTPSVVRNIRDGNLLSLWNAALEDLRCADEWIMLGYSLPSEDVAIRSLLLRAYHARRARAEGEEVTHRELRVRVVLYERDNPAPPGQAIDAYRALFPGENLSAADYDARGIKCWFEDLESIGTDRGRQKRSRRPRPAAP